MAYRALADLIVVLHLAFIVFVVLMLPDKASRACATSLCGDVLSILQAYRWQSAELILSGNGQFLYE